MKRVLKYHLVNHGHSWGETQIELPEDAKIVHVDTQANKIFVWVETFNSNKKKLVSFFIAGTGQKIPSEYRHKQTIKVNTDIVHIYTKTEN